MWSSGLLAWKQPSLNPATMNRESHGYFFLRCICCMVFYQFRVNNIPKPSRGRRWGTIVHICILSIFILSGKRHLETHSKSDILLGLRKPPQHIPICRYLALAEVLEEGLMDVMVGMVGWMNWHLESVFRENYDFKGQRWGKEGHSLPREQNQQKLVSTELLGRTSICLGFKRRDPHQFKLNSKSLT